MPGAQTGGEAKDETSRTMVFNKRIRKLSRAKQWEQVLETWSQMQVDSIPRDIVTYNTVISACGKSGDWQKAVELFESMESEGGIAPSTISFNAALGACSTGEQWERVMALHEDMLRRGVPCDPITYGTLSVACEKLGRRPAEAQKWREQSASGSENRSSEPAAAAATPNHRQAAASAARHAAENTPLHQALESKDWSRALELVKQGSDVNLRDSTGKTPLMLAAMHGSQLAEVLLEHGAAKSVSFLSNQALTAAHYARIHGNEALASKLQQLQQRQQQETGDPRLVCNLCGEKVRARPPLCILDPRND